MSADPALERASAAALRVRYEGLPDGRAVERGGWVALSWPQRPRSTWAHRLTAVGPVTGRSLDAALHELPGVPVLATLAEGALDDATLAGRGFSRAARLQRLVAPAGGPPAPSDRFWLEMVGPQGGGEVSAVGRAGGGPDEPWWWVAPLGAPGWTQLVAYDGDDPVATGAVHVAGPVASLDGLARVPGRAGHEACVPVVRRLVALAAAGGALQVTATAEPGTVESADLLGCGFVPAYDLVPWSRGAGAGGSGAEALSAPAT